MSIKKTFPNIWILIAIMLSLLVSSCSSSSQPLATESLAADHVVGPSEVSTSDDSDLVVVVQDEPSLAWHATGLADIIITSNIYESLITRDANGTLSPALAESWEQMNDNTWRVNLKQIVTIHD